MSYRIASFNIQKFGQNTSAKKDLSTIGRIIREQAIDIIAIQEITHSEALRALLEEIAQQYPEEHQLKRGSVVYDNISRLSNRTTQIFGYKTKRWEGRWAAPVASFGGNAAEGYAFIWNRDRIKLVTNYEGEVFEPRIETFSGKNKLVRPPFIGRFMPINGRCEFRLINTHIAFSVPSKMKNENDPLYKADWTDQQLREDELHRLLNTVYTNWDKKYYDVNRKDNNPRPLTPYTFLLGDYNLNLKGSNVGHTYIPDKLALFEKAQKNSEDQTPLWRVQTVNTKLTTLKQKHQGIADDEENKILHLANNYDHFSYDIVKLQEHKIQCPEPEVIYAFDYYKSTNEHSRYDLYREKVSDHLPIFIDFDIRKKPFATQQEE